MKFATFDEPIRLSLADPAFDLARITVLERLHSAPKNIQDEVFDLLADREKTAKTAEAKELSDIMRLLGW